jgi:septum formation protein
MRCAAFSASTGKRSLFRPGCGVRLNLGMKLILASASPRRAEILRDAGFSFEVAQANIGETRLRGETARAMTRRLAEAKARAVAEKLGAEPLEAIVIGADTTVELQGRLLGKPGSAKAAREMLLKLSGKTHRVVTSVALFRLTDHARKTATESTRVRFARLTRDEIAAYVDTGESLGKAGAYAVQGIGGCFIERIDGCYFNVVGLPLARLYRMLVSLGWQSPRKTHKGSKAPG